MKEWICIFLAVFVALVPLVAEDTNSPGDALISYPKPDPVHQRLVFDDHIQTPGNSLVWQPDATNSVPWSNWVSIALSMMTNVSVEWGTYWTNAMIVDGRTFVIHKQVGTQVTNRIVTIAHENRTNGLIIKDLGREERPSHFRQIAIPQ